MINRTMKKILFVVAIAAVLCSCNNEDRAKQRSINSLKNAVINLSKVNSLLNNSQSVPYKSVYVDSIANTISRSMSYEQKLLKIYEMEYFIANEVAYVWVNTAVDKYMNSDSTNVIMSDGGGKNADRFRLAIAQNLIDAQTQLNICYAENPLSLRDLSEMSFAALNSYNTLFFCYYFLTDNLQYLQFFSRNSEKVNTLKNYADTIFSCMDVPRDVAFKMAETLESTAFIITMNTLSFNILWNQYPDKMDQMADFFNSYSEQAISTFFDTPDKREIVMFDGKEYAEYLDQATKYKVELMEMVVAELGKQ